MCACVISSIPWDRSDDLSSPSGAPLVQLLHEELLENLRLMVHAIVVGSGKRLFEEGTRNAYRESIRHIIRTISIATPTFGLCSRSQHSATRRRPLIPWFHH